MRKITRLQPGQPQEEPLSEKLSYALRFKKLANAIHAAPDFNTIHLGLRRQILGLYEAEMATIYLVNGARHELFSWVMLPGERLKQIRIPIDPKSIAGYVAQTGRVVNIKNVYDSLELMQIDPELSFDSSWDLKTGKATRQVLAIPILFQSSLLGVIQLINKTDGGEFASGDQKHLFDLAETLGIAFYNQRKFSRKPSSAYALLVRNGLLAEKDFARAELLAAKNDTDLEAVLLKEFKIARRDLGQALAQYFDLPYEDLSRPELRFAEQGKGVNIEYFRKGHCLPLAGENGQTLLVVNNPRDEDKVQEILQVLRTSEVELRVALKEEIEGFLDLHRSALRVKERGTVEKTFTDLLTEMKAQDDGQPLFEEEIEGESPDDRAIVLLARKIIEDAHLQQASDIHIEPYGRRRDAEVRFRVDGRCAKVLTIPRGHSRAVVSRFKLLAKLDISERRKPQDGKIIFRTSGGHKLELRVSTIPTAEGNEDVVLRLLAGSEPLPLADIMPPEVFQPFSEIIRRPYGVVLVVGPTGSGKTTTLHAALGFINTPDKKIWTAEDPVEITQYRLRQVQVNPKIGLTFASAMRAFLRADPDVIMVGEMRDRETAAIGIEASLTGHLVFSTLHTNSAPETITRLVDMGMDPFSFADALLGILAQRLVRTLCPDCKQSYHPEQEEYDRLGQVYGPLFEERLRIPFTDGLRLYKPTGCEKCSGSGYRGRMGLYELLLGSETVKQAVIRRAAIEEIRSLALQEGMQTLLQEGIRAIFAGHTDLVQVKSVCS